MGAVEPGMTPAAPRLAEESGEAALLARATAGDADAFVALVRLHDRSLRALVYRMTYDRDAMDDVLQDVYIRGFRALPSFRGDSSAATWLYRIAYNACLDELRRRGRRREVPIEAAGDSPSAAPDPADLAALRGDLSAALETLPPEQRAAVLLVDLHGMDYATAGEILGVAPGTVGSRVSRSRALLREVLRPSTGSTGDPR